MTFYSAKEVSEIIGIGESTARTWARDFEIEHKRKGLKMLFSKDALDIFKTVQQLRESDAGQNTIRRTIHPNQAVAEQESSSNMTDMLLTEQESVTAQSVIIKTVVAQAIQENNELAEKYALACRHIGSLEEQVKNLTTLTESQSQHLKLLPSADYHQSVINRNKDLETELEDLKAKQSLMKSHWLVKLLFKNERK